MISTGMSLGRRAPPDVMDELMCARPRNNTIQLVTEQHISVSPHFGPLFLYIHLRGLLLLLLPVLFVLVPSPSQDKLSIGASVCRRPKLPQARMRCTPTLSMNLPPYPVSRSDEGVLIIGQKGGLCDRLSFCNYW